MLCGWGMNADNRAKSAATFNQLWDDGEISVNRRGDGRLQLYDRRLSAHWLIQPDAATQAVQDPLLSNIGFWPRFLCAWPAPNKPRVARALLPEKDPGIKAFWRRCTELPATPVGENCGNLPVLEANAESETFICEFFARMEQSAKARDGILIPVKPFALRATENVFRIVGVLSVFSVDEQITLATAQRAAASVGYSLETWRGIFGAREEMTARTDASLLLKWLRKQLDGIASETAIVKIGPKRLRTKHRRDGALSVLEHAGAMKRLPGRYWKAGND